MYFVLEAEYGAVYFVDGLVDFFHVREAVLLGQAVCEALDFEQRLQIVAFGFFEQLGAFERVRLALFGEKARERDVGLELHFVAPYVAEDAAHAGAFLLVLYHGERLRYLAQGVFHLARDGAQAAPRHRAFGEGPGLRLDGHFFFEQAAYRGEQLYLRLLARLVEGLQIQYPRVVVEVFAAAARDV